MPNRYQLAQANVGRLRAPLHDASLADFIAQLDHINAIADQAPGFVWRLKSDSGNATDIRAFDDERVLINLSVWETLSALQRYAYDGPHAVVLRRRHEWFEKLNVYVVLWWLPAGTLPTVEAAQERLTYLTHHGPTPYAFTFARAFPAPE